MANGVTVSGNAIDGTPVVDAPVILGGKDVGGNTRTISVSTDRNPEIAGAGASGAAAVGKPVRIGGNDGSNTQDLKVNALGQAAVTTEGQKTTYSFSVTGFTPVASPTDFANIVGSATKTVRITKVEVSGSTTDANPPILNLAIIKRSTAGTIAPGAYTSLTGVPHDSSDAAVTAVVNTVGTANPGALGTSVGQVAAKKFFFGTTPYTATDFPVVTPTIFTFTDHNEKGIVLRGVAQQLGLSFGGATIPTATLLDINVTVTEE